MSSPRSWWRPTAVDSRDARAFGFPAVRTLLVRVVLAAGAVVLLAAATASAMGLDPRDRGLLEEGTGVVVVDLSLSIEDDTSGAVRNALRRLIAADAPVGLVVFSDVAYELLPPGTPPSELKGLVRMLTPVAGAGVVNPWSDTFRAGTRISSAMQLAHAMLEADNVEERLGAPDQRPRDRARRRACARSRRSARCGATTFRCTSSPSDRRATAGCSSARSSARTRSSRRLLPNEAMRTPTEVAGRCRAACSCSEPLFLVALAAHELFAGRLALPRAPRLRRRAA